MVRVIVAGGRDFNDYNLLKKTMDDYLSKFKDKIIIVSGGARGADALGEKYAQEHGYEVRRYFAHWEKYGKRAGMVRNDIMAQSADALVAFWDGESHGTQNMIQLAKRYELETHIEFY